MKALINKDDIVISSFSMTEKDTLSYFITPASQSKMNVEICVYDEDTKTLTNTYNYTFIEFNDSKFITIIQP